MKKFKSYDQKQGIFKTIIPEQLLEENHPARIIDKVVGKLDLQDIYASYSDDGQPAYHPMMMIKVLFYAYFRGDFSCRQIWSQLKYRADYIYISGDQVPDFRTINRFRTRHMEEMPKLFARIVLMCVELGMVGFEHMSIDTERLHGNASYQKNFDRERLQKRLKHISKRMEKLLKREPDEHLTTEEKTARLSRLSEQKRKLEELDEALKEVEGTLNLTDREAKPMKHRNGRTLPGYNHLCAVDGRCGVTVAVDTLDRNETGRDVLPALDQAKENTGGKFQNVTADSQFSSYALYKEIESRPEEFYIPDMRATPNKNPFDHGKFRLRRDGSVVCPEGFAMRRRGAENHENHKTHVYVGTACLSCRSKERCTKAKYRKIGIDDRQPFRDKMRRKLSTPEGRRIYGQRKHIVEPTNGHDKKNKKWTQHFLRGKAKAALEFMLMRIGANLNKIVLHRSEEVLCGM